MITEQQLSKEVRRHKSVMEARRAMDHFLDSEKGISMLSASTEEDSWSGLDEASKDEYEWLSLELLKAQDSAMQELRAAYEDRDYADCE